MANKYIVDVSGYNGDVNWSSLKKQGIKGGIVKIIRKDLDLDVQFENNLDKLVALNMPLGVYNYSYALNAKKSKSDMNLVCDILDEKKKEGKLKELKYGVWFDIEDAIQAHLSKSQFADIINTAQNVVESRGYKFGVYTGMSYYNEHMKGADIKTKNWWIARYYNSYNPMTLMQTPNESFKPLTSLDPVAWQYSSSVALPATGNNGRGDVSVLYHDMIGPSEAKKEETSMKVQIGSARIDENSNISHGSAGDQTGREVAVENYYVHSKGWIVLRPKSKKVAEKLAYDMKAACNNSNIGYDQSQRDTLYTQAEKVGFDCAKVKTKCETDCSALVRVCLAYAGIKVGNFNTASERSIIMSTNKFTALSDVAEKNLQTGDILVTKTQGHTAIVVSGKTATDTATKEPVKEETQTNTKAPSKTPKWVGEVCNCDRLNVRTWAGMENENIKSYPILARGNKVDVCDTVDDSKGNPWYYVRIAGKYYGFVSAKYIKKV